MQPVVFGSDYVYLYASQLYTVSPLLKHVYCESHAWEPWAVHGRPQQHGRYEFDNVLYVPRHERDRLLQSIPERLREDPTCVDMWARQFRQAGRDLIRAWRRQEWPLVIEGMGRVLSVGIFKEVFEAPQAALFLADYAPLEPIRSLIARLYQPRCLPHFLKFELKRLFFAEQRAAGHPGAVASFIRTTVHHSRFQLEETPLHDVDEAANALQAHRIDRRSLLQRHADAAREAGQAEHEILALSAAFATSTLRSRLTLLRALEFIRFLSTWEELKHILVVEAASHLRRTMVARGLDVKTAGATAFGSHR